MAGQSYCQECGHNTQQDPYTPPPPQGQQGFPLQGGGELYPVHETPYAPPPPENYQQHLGPQYPAQGYPPGPLKSKVVAGILGILLGGFGIHNFYLGKSGRALLQIFLTLITFGIAGLWGFIEGIMILVSNDWTDGQGRPMKEDVQGRLPPPGY